MSMDVKEIKDWLDTLDPDDGVGVDEGGLCLVVEGEPDCYLEIGGIPLPEDESEDD